MTLPESPQGTFPRSYGRLGRCWVGMLLLFLWGGLPVAAAAPVSLHHDLKIVLHPERQRLSGVDAVTVRADGAPSLVFRLSRKAAVQGVRVGEKGRSFRFRDGVLEVGLEPPERSQSLVVTVEYSAVFDDEVPEAPANTDNPGYGVVGVVSERGSFLLAGSGWYPDLPGSHATYRLSAEVPAGVVAVTAGRGLGHETRAGRTVSTWQVDHPLPGLSLSAGPYVVREARSGRVVIATYFTAQDEDLSTKYIEKVTQYLNLYESLIGPYPFEKFAVVENFFPTGYGFPSYTLMGATVLRLPFILDTSLGHEVAHSWFGNGVLVDGRRGNWCEGLTTYLSDYLYKERASEGEAREYRVQILRNFTTLVTPERDFPLRRFVSRTDPASQAIGYGKAAMVFHMLRRSLGEDAFWGALRDIYRERLFKETSWDDLQAAFERRAGVSLARFFDQWLSRTGAPRLELVRVDRQRQGEGWVVSGEIVQEPPIYHLDLTVRVDAAGQVGWGSARVSGANTPIRVNTPGQPDGVVVDPACDTFRYLAPSEIPPSINSLKASQATAVVLTEPGWEGMERAAEFLVQSLGLENAVIVPAARFDPAKLKDHDLLVVGLPGDGMFPVQPPRTVVLERDRFTVEGRTFARPSDAFFGVFPRDSGRHLGVFHPLSAASAFETVGKITHYGRYGYLVFSEGRNVVKGHWPITGSPLEVRWDR